MTTTTMTTTKKALKHRLGKRAFRAVVCEAPNVTVGHLRDLAKRYKRKTRSIAVTLDDMRSLYDDLALERELASTPAARDRGIIKVKRSRYRPWRYRPVSLDQRVLVRVERQAKDLLFSSLRQYARQSYPVVNRCDTFAETTAQLRTERGWIEYSDMNRQGIVDACYSLTLLKGWFSYPSWLKCVDGLITLAALPVDTGDPDEHCYRARWAQQTQGGVTVKEGVILRRGPHTAHGKTLAAARGSISRQLPEAIAASSERARQRAVKRETLRCKILKRLEAGQINGNAAVEVSMRHSTAVGNCTSGTIHWLARHFPGTDPRRDSLPVSELLAVDDLHDRVLLACAEAIRRVSVA